MCLPHKIQLANGKVTQQLQVPRLYIAQILKYCSVNQNVDPDQAKFLVTYVYCVLQLEKNDKQTRIRNSDAMQIVVYIQERCSMLLMNYDKDIRVQIREHSISKAANRCSSKTVYLINIKFQRVFNIVFSNLYTLVPPIYDAHGINIFRLISNLHLRT